MPALIVFKGKEPGVRRPSAECQVKLVLPRRRVNGYLFQLLNAEQGREGLRERVAGFVIVQPPVCGLYLVVRVRVAQKYLALLVLLLANGRYVL